MKNSTLMILTFGALAYLFLMQRGAVAPLSYAQLPGATPVQQPPAGSDSMWVALFNGISSLGGKVVDAVSGNTGPKTI